ncbi:hypothetical protein [Pseudomonas aeruginosa]|uniref:hypothetical protein n=1 Tax=Pseudomonas aeruginosa TaxID=287 RepID=UPI000FC3FC19|nr:hypothetical protein [Pseudomonas aeruginosa]QTQ98557.1 hypothetical protein J9247_02995 [Pseudomonas aeruginosa]RUD97934.1 hypothetical protein IPC1228_22200 [Pseudomonas aeruginosa]HBP5740821.1 hypothetical protein [Pseudomonas aeruginosa]HCD9811675.1 hypothetical protein [Pseudomonas aeruginosa]HCF2497462.1 hypothetical protein [Pseudomonas aeruginosa]
MKLYAAKSSAIRAAKAAGLEQYEIVEQDGQFGFRSIEAEDTSEGEALEAMEQEEASAPVVKTRNASTVASPVKRVWAIADSMPEAKRKDVIAACVEEGIAFFTARTQYQKWKQNQAT